MALNPKFKTYVCCKCKKRQPISEFRKNKARKYWYCERCNSCERERQRNTAYRNVKYLHDYLEQHPCTWCWESNRIFLDFHHVDPTQKIWWVFTIARKARSLERVIVEMNKCIVLCCKCHKLHHHEESLASKS